MYDIGSYLCYERISFGKGNVSPMSDPDPTDNFIGTILLAIYFLIATALLATGEVAFDALGDARVRELEEDGNRRARRIRRMTESHRRFLARLQGGYLLHALLGAAVLLRRFAPLLAARLCGTPAALPGWATLTAFVLLALLIVLVYLIFGQLVPRRLALRNPEETALSIVNAFSVLYTLLAPLDWLAHGIAAIPLRLCGVHPGDDPDRVTEDDIRELMDVGEEAGAIEGIQKNMVNNIFEFDDITAGEIMTPRTDMVAVEINAPIAAAVEKAVDNGCSRLPVYEEDVDHIVGILYIKDLLPYVGQTIPAQISVRVLLRETHFVPDTKKCDDLFEEMNEKHLQMAIVVDEYGGVAGLVTMEDLLESIVGNMQDEFDNEEEEVTRLDDHSFVVDGSMSVSDLDELLEIELPEGDYDTVAGFLMDQLGHIPAEDEQARVQWENVTFTIQKMDDRRIEQVLVHKEPPAEPEASEKTEAD